MSRSLKAFAALSILTLAACQSDAVDDELAVESTDESLEGKSDHTSPDGTYTYFEVWTDFRKCAYPLCGGFYIKRLNRTSTICHNGLSRSSCYTPELDWSESDLGTDLQGAFRAAAERDATSAGVIAIARGRFAPKQYSNGGNLGRFVVTEAWVAENDAVSDGVFVKVRDNGVRCIQAPCPTIGEKALNSSATANAHGLDFEPSGLDEDQQSKIWNEMVATPHGVLIAGWRYTFTENNQSAKGRTVTAAYRRLVDQTCYVGGCSSQVCSDRPDVITTCEWRDEYACYQGATCERQGDGQCGWTETPELLACLGN